MKQLIIGLTQLMLIGGNGVKAQSSEHRYINQKSIGGFFAVGMTNTKVLE